MSIPNTFRKATSIARHWGGYIERELREMGADPWRTNDNEIYWDWESPDGALYCELRIVDSYENDGSEDGFNFSFTSCTEGGEIGPSACPYNFTDYVWTRDAQELGARLEMVLDYVRYFQDDHAPEVE